jgi:putative salt-induced outer membrane protein
MSTSRFAGVLLPAFLCCVLAAGNASAEWTGSGELGLVFARGNTDTETLNTELKLKYTRERWTNASRLSYLRSESDGNLEADRFVFDNKTDYTLSDVSYITGVGRFDQDEFSSFEFQTSLAIGYGRKLIDTERQAFSVEIGPGVRYSEIRDTGETETDLIARGGADYRLQISETADLTNRSLVESGSSNTFFENETAFSVAINDTLALKTGFLVRHNTDVEPGSEKTDYLTTVNLVYSFPKS